VTARSDIVDALKTVPELAPAAVMPDTIHAGHAWPAWASTEPVNRCANLITWYVFVALPAASAASTVDAADDLVDDIAVALGAVGKVVRWEPWRIPIEPGQQGIPVVRYTLEV
jgi:hypothetical protein